jgi:hypothetical protein
MEYFNKLIADYEKNILDLEDKANKEGSKMPDHIIYEKLRQLQKNHKNISYCYNINIKYDDFPKFPRNQQSDVIFANQKWYILDYIAQEAGVYSFLSTKFDISPQIIRNTYSAIIDLLFVFAQLESEFKLKLVVSGKKINMDSDIYLIILAYQLIRYTMNKLQAAGLIDIWPRIRTHLARQGRLTITVSDEKAKKRVSIRKATKATPRQAEIYRALGLASSPGGVVKTQGQ